MNSLTTDSNCFSNSYLYWKLGKLQNKTIDGQINLSWNEYPFRGNVTDIYYLKNLNIYIVYYCFRFG